MIKKVFILLFLLSAVFASAQDNISAPQMADAFRDDGKIWVVITVIGIIFISLVIFLLLLERKVNKLEKQINKN